MFTVTNHLCICISKDFKHFKTMSMNEVQISCLLFSLKLLYYLNYLNLHIFLYRFKINIRLDHLVRKLRPHCEVCNGHAVLDRKRMYSSFKFGTKNAAHILKTFTRCCASFWVSPSGIHTLLTYRYNRRTIYQLSYRFSCAINTTWRAPDCGGRLTWGFSGVHEDCWEPLKQPMTNIPTGS